MRKYNAFEQYTRSSLNGSSWFNRIETRRKRIFDRVLASTRWPTYIYINVISRAPLRTPRLVCRRLIIVDFWPFGKIKFRRKNRIFIQILCLFCRRSNFHHLKIRNDLFIYFDYEFCVH